MMRRRPRSSAASLPLLPQLYVHCRDCALRRQPAFRALSNSELRALAEMKRAQLLLRPGELLVAQGGHERSFYTIYEGWALRFHTLDDETQQVLDVLLPGDTVALGTVFTPHIRSSVRALTKLRVCVLNSEDFPRWFASHPALALDVLHSHLRERERQDQRLTALGRLSAPQRIGNLFVEVRRRLRERHLMRGSICEWPLSRQDLADAVGLSKVHLMRALRELRRGGLANLRGQFLTVSDERHLASYSEYIRPPKTGACVLL